MGKGHNALVLVLISCVIASSNADDIPANTPAPTQTWTELLRKDLLLHYDRNVRPAQPYNITNVDFRLTINHVNIDEESSVFSLYGMVTMTWNDEKMKWDPNKYNGVVSFLTTPESVWKPDILLYTTARGSDNLHYGGTNVLIHHNGTVLWTPPTEYHNFCDLHLGLWPFDSQTCMLKIGSWRIDSLQLNLTADRDTMIEINVPNNKWTIRKVKTKCNSVFYNCCPEPYYDITYDVTLQRQSSTHKTIVVCPAFVIMLLALSVFWIPPHCGEKIFLNGIIILIVTIFLIYFAQQLSASTGSTPLIVTFFSTTLFLVAISTIVTVIVLRMSRNQHSRPVPRLLKKQLDGCLGSIFGLESDGGLPSYEEKEAESGEIDTDLKQRDWWRLAALIDRLAFIAYLFIFIICIFYYSL